MTPDTLRIHHEAQADIVAAFEWYFERSPESADRFLTSLHMYFDQITVRPRSFAVYSARTRRCVMDRFPYSILFQEKSEAILIVAIAHSKRDPDFWQKRL